MLTDSEKKFLRAVLGEEGLLALSKAISREPKLASVLVPRSIVGWLSLATAREFEGAIPGIDDSYIQFTKSENTFSGALTFSDGIYDFQSSSLYHLATAISLSIGHEPSNLDVEIRNAALKKLGGSIDVLVKAQVVAQYLAKARLGPLVVATYGNVVVEKTTEGLFNIVAKKTNKVLEENITNFKEANSKASKYSRMDKAESAGGPHKPTAQVGPTEPNPPQKQPKNTNRISVTKSQSEKQCHVCGCDSFRDNQFRGCICFRDLAPDTVTHRTSTGYLLTFRKSADPEAVWLLEKTFKKTEG